MRAKRNPFAAVGGYRVKQRPVRSIAKRIGTCPLPRREGDELVCRCGVRWGADEARPACRSAS